MTYEVCLMSHKIGDLTSEDAIHWLKDDCEGLMEILAGSIEYVRGSERVAMKGFALDIETMVSACTEAIATGESQSIIAICDDDDPERMVLINGLARVVPGQIESQENSEITEEEMQGILAKGQD